MSKTTKLLLSFPISWASEIFGAFFAVKRGALRGRVILYYSTHDKPLPMTTL
jgi:hypothetical protein